MCIFLVISKTHTVPVPHHYRCPGCKTKIEKAGESAAVEKTRHMQHDSSPTSPQTPAFGPAVTPTAVPTSPDLAGDRLSVCLLVCLSACLLVCLSACLPVCASAVWSVGVSVDRSINLSMCTCLVSHLTRLSLGRVRALSLELVSTHVSE